MSLTKQLKDLERELKALNSTQLDATKSTLLQDDSEDEDDDEYDEYSEAKKADILVDTLKLACQVIRKAQRDNKPDLANIVEKVGECVDRGINMAYGRGMDIKFLSSFAHRKDTLVNDPLRDPRSTRTSLYAR